MRKRILLIDDDKDDAEIFSDALDEMAVSAEVVHFLDGKQSHSLLLELFTDAGIGTEIAAGKS